MTLAYHFTSDRLRDGRPVPAIGETLVHDGPIKWCKSGLYASREPFDSLQFAPGPWLHHVECDQIEREDVVKFVCRCRTILATIDATDLLRSFARAHALIVFHLYRATGDESLRYVAQANVVTVARTTAQALVRNAAWSAARASTAVAARTDFNARVETAFQDAAS